MKNNIKYFVVLAAIALFVGCKKTDYSMGSLDAPSNVVINAEIVGQDAAHPDGDGSGDVKFSITGNNTLAYKIDYDANNAVDLVSIPNGQVTKKYTTLGVNNYTVTAVVFGKGGTSTTVSKDITVKSDFTPDASIITALTNDASKTWKVNEDVAGHFGVGPWTPGSVTPEWYSAVPHEKAICCHCFYSARFTFTKVSAGNYTLQVETPEGAFTKTGTLAGGLPGIPASGAEACYPYSGGTSGFSFVPSGSGVTGSVTTGTSILLGGNNTFIGYGALLKEYEIFNVNATDMYLRVQGTETGNAWYLKLVAL
ncbi:MAG: hypothetical protein ABIN36_04250 [Ferruginibacter sp.]